MLNHATPAAAAAAAAADDAGRGPPAVVADVVYRFWRAFSPTPNIPTILLIGMLDAVAATSATTADGIYSVE